MIGRDESRGSSSGERYLARLSNEGERLPSKQRVGGSNPFRRAKPVACPMMRRRARRLITR